MLKQNGASLRARTTKYWENLDTAFKKQFIEGKHDVITQYLECFDEVVKFQGEYHILIAPNVPRCTTCCPFSKKCAIKELDEIVRNNNMTKIEDGEPTQWVRSLVYHRK